MQVGFTVSGDKSVEKWLKNYSHKNPSGVLNSIGAKGVGALQASTPIDTGQTARGWAYKTLKTGAGWEVAWYNRSHPETSANIALLLQYGHDTGTGGYVPGRDYINPAMRGVLGRGASEIEREMIR